MGCGRGGGGERGIISPLPLSAGFGSGRGDLRTLHLRAINSYFACLVHSSKNSPAIFFFTFGLPHSPNRSTQGMVV